MTALKDEEAGLAEGSLGHWKVATLAGVGCVHVVEVEEEKKADGEKEGPAGFGKSVHLAVRFAAAAVAVQMEDGADHGVVGGAQISAAVLLRAHSEGEEGAP